jgi:small neutral amino acid transporter SnatA (MarC family)
MYIYSNNGLRLTSIFISCRVDIGPKDSKNASHRTLIIAVCLSLMFFLFFAFVFYLYFYYFDFNSKSIKKQNVETTGLSATLLSQN